MKAVVFRARGMLVALSLAALLVLALAAPVAAQEETTEQATDEAQAVQMDRDDPSGEPRQSAQGGDQQAGDATDGGDVQATARASDSLQDAAVTIKSDDDGAVNRIEIAAADCDVEKGATVTVLDENRRDQTFTHTGDVAAEGAAIIEATGDQILVTGTEDDLNNRFGTSDTGNITASTGITCGRENDRDNNAGDDARNPDDLEELSCAKLLVLFRSDNGSRLQYGDADALADPGVRARIEVCLEKEIVKDTAADEDLPDTGGLSLVGLAVLGAVSAAAGLSLIRGGRR